MKRTSRDADFSYRFALKRSRVRGRTGGLLVPIVLGSVFLILSASVGHCAPVDTPGTATIDFVSRAETDFRTLLSQPCCNGPRFPSVIDLEQNCEAEEISCIDVYADTDFRDRAGLRSDTYHFLSYQVVAIGILYLMPESISGWSDEQKDDYSLSIWWYNVRHPTWDTDDAFINYVTHPYWGSAYFVRARERGYTSKEAFWYSAGLSAAYEFGAEALFEQPSIQDLIVTPVFGSLLGGYFMGVRNNIRERSAARGYRTTGDKWVWVLTDPLGAINRTVDGWFGLESNLQIRPGKKTGRLVWNSSCSGELQWLAPVNYRSEAGIGAAPTSVDRSSNFAFAYGCEMGPAPMVCVWGE